MVYRQANDLDARRIARGVRAVLWRRGAVRATEKKGSSQQDGPGFSAFLRRMEWSRIGVSRGFSLVELVIVVVIIGIIAAIAVPRISAGVGATGESALMADLFALRGAIDRYAAEHGGDFPGVRADGQGNGPNTPGAFESQLIKYSNGSGNVSDSPDAAHEFGPYVRAIPALPVGGNKGDDTVAIDLSNSPPLVAGGSAGWVYNPTTGEIIANSDDANQAGTRAYDEY